LRADRLEVRREIEGETQPCRSDARRITGSDPAIGAELGAQIGGGNRKGLALDSSDATLKMSLGRDRQAPSLARRAVACLTETRAIAPQELATLTLLVSELVSNAVLHSDAPSASDIHLQAQFLQEGVVRVEVIDRGSGFTAAPRDPGQSIGGYGLYLVDKQASRWGVDREGGTRVWFELETAPGS
jgi:anti-sigma regulatory factor (Ser/Thr protein kinase)